MADPAFSSRPDCSIPFVENIVPNLVKDCEVPDAAEPVWEAFNYDPLLMPPPLGCPPFEFSTTASMSLGLEQPVFSASFSPQPESGDDNCYPFLSFDLVIPEMLIECASYSTDVTLSAGSAGSATLAISLQSQDSQTNPPECVFDVELDLQFPCTYTSVTLSGTASFHNSDGVVVTGEVETTTDDSNASCQADTALSLDLDLPCPSYDLSMSPTMATNFGAGSLVVSASPSYDELNTERCAAQMDFTFDLQIPCTCLEASAGTNNVTFLSPGESLTASATPSVYLDEETTDACNAAIAIDLDLSIPCMGLTLGNVSIGSVDIDGTPTLDFSITDNNSACGCANAFMLSIDVPRLSGVSTSNTGSGSTVTDVALTLVDNALVLTVTKGSVQAKYC